MLTSKSDPYPIGRRFLSIVVVTGVLGGPTSLARAQGVRTGGDTLTQPVPTAGAQTAVPPSGQQATISSGSSCHGIPVRSTNQNAGHHCPDRECAAGRPVVQSGAVTSEPGGSSRAHNASSKSCLVWAMDHRTKLDPAVQGARH